VRSADVLAIGSGLLACVLYLLALPACLRRVGARVHGSLVLSNVTFEVYLPRLAPAEERGLDTVAARAVYQGR
jgi:hypothetical protein